MTLVRKTIFFDTSDLLFLGNDQSLVLVLNPGFSSNREDKFVYKYKYKNNIKKEHIFQFPYLSHIQENQIEVYDSMEDAAGIYVQQLEAWNEAVRKHFTNKYVYQVSPN